jgi:hypothetical protein
MDIDTLFTNIINDSAKWFSDNDTNAAGVSTFAAISGLVTSRLIYTHHSYMAAITFIIALYLNTVSVAMLRNERTDQEDQMLYQRITYSIVYLLILYMLYDNYKASNCTGIILIAMFFVVLLGLMNEGCNEITNRKITRENKSIMLQGFCPATTYREAKQAKHYMNWISVRVINVMLLIAIWLSS